jgi:hypothetical protein
MIVMLPQHFDHAGFEGDEIELEDNGRFSINGYEGLTVLTPAQAREVAAMLLEWADKQ